MKAIKFAGLVALLVAPVAMATDAVVTFNVNGIASDYNAAVSYDIGAIPQDAPDVWITWTYSVAVTGNNKGLAGYNAAMGVWKTGGPVDVISAIPMDADHTGGSEPAGYSWAAVYKSANATGGAVKDVGSAGGPGLSAVAETGTFTAGKAYIAGMGAGLLNYDPYRYVAKQGWQGAATWGVGMDSRKANLLSSSSTYDLMTGYFDVTDYAPGTYKLALAEVGGVAVLSAEANLNTLASGATFAVDAANVHTQYLTFTIVPEPATLVLLAGAALLYRRRRA